MTTTPTPPTDDELAAMRARVDAATPGPWATYEDGADWGISSIADGVTFGQDSIVYVGWLGRPSNDNPHLPKVRANHAFIAAARRDMQTLLDEVARLRTELEGAHGMIATLPVDELAIALEIAYNIHEGHRTVNLYTWLSDNGETIKDFAAQWHDDHAVKIE